MSTTFEDSGLSVVDVQSVLSATLNSLILFIFCHGIHTCIFVVGLYYISEIFSFDIHILALTFCIAQSAHSDRKRTAFSAIIAFLWCANTITMIFTWNSVKETFITHGTSLETEFYFNLVHHDWGPLICDIFRALSVLVADLILVCT